jgi:hypothetical protein
MCRKLKKKMKKKNYHFIKNVEDTGIYEREKKTDDELNREKIYFREKLKKIKKRYFRNNDIIIFNQ